MLLEPDFILAGSIKHYFAYAGHNLSVHSDPQAAIAQADKHKPDVVITELQLAGRTGIEFLYELRSYPDWQAIPVVININLHTQELRAYSEIFDELNIHTCLYKPTTSLEQLLKAVENCLKPIHAKV